MDIAALRAAKVVGLETGGYIPNGFRTLVGDKPEYAALYGMTQTASRDWTPRTIANVQSADATLFIGNKSAGFRATEKAALNKANRHKPFLHVPAEVMNTSAQKTVAELLQLYKTGTLNVAGNRDADEQAVEAWLVQLFTLLEGGN